MHSPLIIILLPFVGGALVRPHMVMVGAPTQTEINEEIWSLADSAINEKTNADLGAGSALYVVHSVVGVTKQVVAGTLTKVTVVIVPSTCNKDENTNVNEVSLVSCPAVDNIQGKEQVCRIEIWEKPWMNFRETTVKCQAKPETPVNRTPKDNIQINP